MGNERRYMVGQGRTDIKKVRLTDKHLELVKLFLPKESGTTLTPYMVARKLGIKQIEAQKLLIDLENPGANILYSGWGRHEMYAVKDRCLWYQNPFRDEASAELPSGLEQAAETPKPDSLLKPPKSTSPWPIKKANQAASPRGFASLVQPDSETDQSQPMQPLDAEPYVYPEELKS